VEVTPQAVATLASRAIEQSYGVVGLASRTSRPGLAELLRRDFCLVERLRVDEVADRFGLGKIDAAVEEGTAAEFSGLGDPCSLGCGQRDDFADQVNAAMTVEFGDILAGQAPGPGHQHTHRAVERFTVLGISNFTQLKPASCDLD